ncbi:HutD family protein [Tabrizicola sp.]|uniref:HutD/Ves family protein n=1 Tax=Tabrizicola sp. TaxID=2005166 RepID=UPI002735969E|nr:HutD family protein [Tabrizicola sp.]MDP3194082.1 HutD family protein [Tabrizicola sp.]
MLHLTPADYRVQPWKNGRGTTTELLHLTDPAGTTLMRLSCASVVEDGPFSLFPGLERNLTVLTGTGFRLTGPDLNLRCDPLVPVSFPGDVETWASETNGQPSDDFNVMTARHLPRPEVTVVQNASLPVGGSLALYALAPCRVNGKDIATGDLLLTTEPAHLSGDGFLIAVRSFGL